MLRIDFLSANHREHTILLSRKRANKEMKTINIVYVCLLLLFPTLPGKTADYKSCVNLNLGLSAPANFFSLCIKFDKGGNSFPKHFERNPIICSNL